MEREKKRVFRGEREGVCFIDHVYAGKGAGPGQDDMNGKSRMHALYMLELQGL